MCIYNYIYMCVFTHTTSILEGSVERFLGRVRSELYRFNWSKFNEYGWDKEGLT